MTELLSSQITAEGRLAELLETARTQSVSLCYAFSLKLESETLSLARHCNPG